ncbi:MAG TPA: AAA family ATPase [Candidatus Angelobacter sp.]|nr:AAA family ATPase [Candidatus Angelobacter sp.]
MTASKKRRSKTVLVVGDVNLDVSWPVERQPPGSTSQAHGGVLPEKVSNPDIKMVVLGSAGTIARAVCMADHNVKVILAGGWAAEDDPKKLVPEYEDAGCPDGLKPGGKPLFIRHGHLTFRRLARPDFTRALMRIFVEKKYVKRYDREVVEPPEQLDPTFQWPNPDDIDVVIVGDYNKGLLGNKDVLKGLRKYKGKPFILRAKRKLNHEVVTTLPWTIICPNRQDFVYCLSMERPIPTGLKRIGDQWSCHPDILEGFERFLPKFKDRAILLKLDKEGAVLLNGGQVTLIPLAPSSRSEWDGIGAGDTLMATLAVALCGNTRVDLNEAVVHAVKSATAFCAATSDFGRWKGWYGPTMGFNPTSTGEIEIETSGSLDLKKTLGEWKKRSTYPDLLELPQLCIQSSEWYLPRFLTVNEKFGGDLLRLKFRIKDYLTNRNRGPKPFVAAICGGPGSGKSSLVDALAEELRCRPIKQNATQWSTVDQLWRTCEQVRTEHIELNPALVFIDEVDSQVGGELLFGKLLAPLWDCCYYFQGEERKLGSPSVFLLAGSTPRWQKPQSLLSAKSADKLPDLVSRLSVYPLGIPSLKDRKPDVVYIAAKGLKRRFPDLKEIEKRVLRLFAESDFTHGPRSIEQVIALLESPRKKGQICLEDLRDWYDSKEVKVHMAIPSKLSSWLRVRNGRPDFIELG